MSPGPSRHRPSPVPLWVGCALLVLALRAEPAGSPALPPTLTRRPVAPGIEHWHWTDSVADGPVSLHAAVIDWPRGEFRFEAPLAAGTVTGLRTVAEQIRALPATSGVPLVAVNGDFFVIQPDPYRGDPRGLQVWNGEVVSDAAGTATFWIDARGRARMAVLESRFEARFPGGLTMAVGLNERRADDGAVLYTPRLGTPTRTTGGRELVLRTVPGGGGLPRLGGILTTEVVRVHPGGDHTIPADGLVLSIGVKRAGTLPRLNAGDRIEFALATMPALEAVEMAVAGGPVLVSGGRPETWKSSQPRHPRTAVGWNARQLFLVVVDGRQPGHSVGMTFPELADLMVQLGCEEAMNLDGGGSSTLWVEGQVVNRPSDGRERAVANSLILLRRP